MGNKNTGMKLCVSFLIYMFVYGNLLLIKYYPGITPRELLLRPITDLIHLHAVASIMFVTIIIVFFTTFRVFSRKDELNKLELKLKLELKSIQEKCDEGNNFTNAIDTLRHTRFSYILGQNSSVIELKKLEYIYEEVKLINSVWNDQTFYTKPIR